MGKFQNTILNFLKNWWPIFIVILIFGIGIIAIFVNEKFTMLGASDDGTISWNALCDPLSDPKGCSQQPSWGNAPQSSRGYSYQVTSSTNQVLQSGTLPWNTPNPSFKFQPSTPLKGGDQFTVTVTASSSLGSAQASQKFTYKSPNPVISGITLTNATNGTTDFDMANNVANLEIDFQPDNIGTFVSASGGFYVNGKQMQGQGFKCDDSIEQDKINCKFNVAVDSMYGGTTYQPWASIVTSTGPTGQQKSSTTYTQNKDKPDAPTGIFWGNPLPSSGKIKIASASNPNQQVCFASWSMASSCNSPLYIDSDANIYLKITVPQSAPTETGVTYIYINGGKLEYLGGKPPLGWKYNGGVLSYSNYKLVQSGNTVTAAPINSNPGQGDQWIVTSA